ncbi:uncharacterized protein LOC125751011 [Brienomyrus brachyistius]|uniref:uncharacterized protein LOC125751011 n=1 Tax=Brienomyrus brachyistius TaxID=42636 RepID=UPI0020B41A3C|nr:uncharacterized protein LOC125751011 [Brienomyrus brachyistius]
MDEFDRLSATDQPQDSVPEGPLVVVTFQKDPHQIHKYLESEPKALGISEILFSLFQISLCIITLKFDVSQQHSDYAVIVGSVFVMIAGVMAIAATNLHLPTVKACLGLQVLACLASISNMFVCASKMTFAVGPQFCWMHEHNSTISRICQMMSDAYEHHQTNSFLVNTALVAISATLAAYCCKVVDCCCPKSKMPVITINNTPQAQQ